MSAHRFRGGLRISAGGERAATRAGGIAAVVLLAALMAMVNDLASRHYVLADWTRAGHYTLSDRTTQLLSRLKERVDVYVLFRPDHVLFGDVRRLLEKCRHASRLVHVEFVDPDRDLARTKELAQRYDLTEGNTLVVACAGRSEQLKARTLIEHESAPLGATPPKRRPAFRGEQVISSAIQRVVQARVPIVYFLGGHGERRVGDYRDREGGSAIGRAVRRDNVEIRELVLSDPCAVPPDADALVLAGPRVRLSAVEIAAIRDYLAGGGRGLFLLDAGIHSGLEDLLREWGATAGNDVVVERALVGVRLPGRNVLGIAVKEKQMFVSRYGLHPITHRLQNVTTVFYAPRSIRPVGGPTTGADQTDKPRVSVLAESSPEGWAEADIVEDPPKYDPGQDRPGPVPVAVAVEKGAVSGIDVEIRPTRIVVVGDSKWVANGHLTGGNEDFFLSALNWLLQREDLLAIASKPPDSLRLEMTPNQQVLSLLALAGVVPAAAAFLGVLVWLRRRR